MCYINNKGKSTNTRNNSGHTCNAMFGNIPRRIPITFSVFCNEFIAEHVV